jgi:hypothetical protein
VGLVHNHEVGAGAQEVVTPAVRYNEIHGDDYKRVGIKYGLVGPVQSFLQTPRGAGEHQFGSDVEFGRQFALPLFGEVRWAENAEAGDFTTVQHLASNEAGFNGFTDADIVSDKQTDRVKLQRHEQWDELVRARLNSEPAERTEWSGAGAKAESDCISQKTAGDEIAEILFARRLKARGRDGLQCGMNAGGFLNGASEWTHD